LPLVNLTQAEIDEIVSRVPGGVSNVQDIYPLAPLQEGILFHHLVENYGDTYNLPMLFRFKNRKNLDDFVNALNYVIARHDILRTSFVFDRLHPFVQVVWRDAKLHPTEIEFDICENVQEQMQLIFSNMKYRLNLEIAPILQAIIAYDRQKNEWLLQTISHHIIEDFSSLEIVFNEILAYLAGEFQLLPAAIPFRNVISKMTHFTNKLEGNLFFKKMFQGYQPIISVFGLNNIYSECDKIDEYRIELNKNLDRRVRAAARKIGVTEAVFFHAAWGAIIAKCNQQEDIVIGTVQSGRASGLAETSGMVGLLVNTSPLRIKFSQRSALSLMNDIHIALGGLLQYDSVPLVLSKSFANLNTSKPLFNALINFRRSKVKTKTINNNHTSKVTGLLGFSGYERYNYPLTLAVTDTGSNYILSMQVDNKIDPKKLMLYFCDIFEKLMNSVESIEDRFLLDFIPSPPLDVFAVQHKNNTLQLASGLKSRMHSQKLMNKRRWVKTITEAWKTILLVDHINPDDDFFELGGNSLFAIRLIFLLKSKGYTISLAEFLKAPSFQGLDSLRVAPI
jgi:aryl carrier-like protein